MLAFLIKLEPKENSMINTATQNTSPMGKGTTSTMLINLSTEPKTSINEIIIYWMNELDNSENLETESQNKEISQIQYGISLQWNLK